MGKEKPNDDARQQTDRKAGKNYLRLTKDYLRTAKECRRPVVGCL
jgi:hypothetical protein